MIVKQIETEKVNKRVSSKLSYAEQTDHRIKAPYYRITYTFVYTTVHSRFIRPGKLKRVSFVVLTNNKKWNIFPAGLDHDGFIAMNKETSEYTHGKPISVSFEGDSNDN